MFYRRKLILALLETLGGELSKMDLQKHLFLFTRSQDMPSYDFVPFRFGCFSFGADADRAPMIRSGLLHENDIWKRKTKTSYVAALTPEDRKRLAAHKTRYGHLRGDDLIREVYTSYPYYAGRSEIAERLLSASEWQQVVASRPVAQEPCLFTIGYEGQSLEAYLNKLLTHKVDVLCDVRKNPVSMKFGFSKRQLQGTVEKLGIRYVHIPELGIASGKRKALDSSEAYVRLFDEYERETLPYQTEALRRIHHLICECDRVALTCFEMCHTECHRSRVADALTKLPQWSHPVVHI